MVGGGALPDAGGGPERLAVHVAAVPRVGLPLHPRGRAARRAEAGDARGPLHPGDGARADPGAQGHRVGHRPHDGVAGLRAPRPPRLRHVVGAVGRLRRLTVGRRAPADDPRDLPERQLAPRTPTGSPRRRRWPPRSAARTPSTSRPRSGRRCPPCR